MPDPIARIRSLVEHAQARHLPATHIAMERLRAGVGREYVAQALATDVYFRNEKKCTTALFRPFGKQYSEFAKNLLLLLLDGYGDVVHVTDETFNTVEYHGFLGEAYGRYTESMRDILEEDGHLEIWNMVMRATDGDPLQRAGRKYTDEEWEENVERLISTELDVAFIDLSRLRRNVLWEIETCRAHLPPERIIFVGHRDGLNTDQLREHGLIPRDVIQYSDIAGGDEPFEHAIHERMCRIVTAYRDAYIEVLQLAEANSLHDSIMDALWHLGEAAQRLGEPQRAIAFYERTAAIASELDNPEMIQRMREARESADLQQGVASAGDELFVNEHGETNFCALDLTTRNAMIRLCVADVVDGDLPGKVVDSFEGALVYAGATPSGRCFRVVASFAEGEVALHVDFKNHLGKIELQVVTSDDDGDTDDADSHRAPIGEDLFVWALHEEQRVAMQRRAGRLADCIKREIADCLRATRPNIVFESRSLKLVLADLSCDWEGRRRRFDLDAGLARLDRLAAMLEALEAG